MKGPPDAYDFEYWRDLFLGALGAVAIVGSLGHTIGWFEKHRPVDRNVALGFLLAYGVLALLFPNRYRYFFLTLIVIIAWGILGSVSHATLIGLPVIICCVVLAALLIKWKGDDLLK